MVTEELQNLVDRVGMKKVLLVLTAICSKKAFRLRREWGEKSAADNWEIVSNKLGVIADRIIDRKR